MYLLWDNSTTFYMFHGFADREKRNLRSLQDSFHFACTDLDWQGSCQRAANTQNNGC